MPVSATKGLTGHPLGATGAIEAVMAALAMRDGWIPGTANLDAPEPELAALLPGLRATAATAASNACCRPRSGSAGSTRRWSFGARRRHLTRPMHRRDAARDSIATMSEPTWERRFRAPLLAFPVWATDAPDRLVMASTESGSYQLHTWDRATGERRQVTEDPVGVLEGRPTRDGTGVIWFHDATGAESGSYVIAPFDERVAPEPLLEGMPEGWTEGLAIGRTRTIAGLSTDEGYSVWAAERGGVARKIHEHQEPVRLAGGWGLNGAVDRRALSSDESIVVIEVMDDGDVLHPSLRSIDARTGDDRRGAARPRPPAVRARVLAARGRHADRDHARAHRRGAPGACGTRAPATSSTCRWTSTGPVQPVDWWPDGSALLLLQLVDGRHRLHRYELATAPSPRSTRSRARSPRPPSGPTARSGTASTTGPHPATLLAVGSTTPLLEALGAAAPAGRPFEPWWFENPNGQRVHGFLVRPEGDGPYPVIMRVHGGPHFLDMDRWVPDIQAHVDAGFLVAMVNYRGSVGFGQAWRDELTGQRRLPRARGRARRASTTSSAAASPTRPARSSRAGRGAAT